MPVCAEAETSISNIIFSNDISLNCNSTNNRMHKYKFPKKPFSTDSLETQIWMFYANIKKQSYLTTTRIPVSS